MKDVNGTEIVIGDKVVVAHRKGSSQWLTTKIVVSIQPYHNMWRPVLSNGKRQYVYRGTVDAIMVINKVTHEKDNQA